MAKALYERPRGDSRLPGSKSPRCWRVVVAGRTVYEGDDPIYAFDMAEMLREEEPRGVGIRVVCILLKQAV